MNNYTIIIIWGKPVVRREFGEGVGEIPEPIELYHKIKNKIVKKFVFEDIRNSGRKH